LTTSADPHRRLQTTYAGLTLQEDEAREFQVGDSILKHVIQSTQEKNSGKLGPNWEGTYMIVVRGGKGSYTLAGQDGKMLDKQ